VRALAGDGTNLYAGGEIYDPVDYNLEFNGVAKWTGTAWTNLGTGLGMNGVAYALEIVDGTLYVGGDFSEAGGVPATGFAKWDGSSWTSAGEFDTNYLSFTDMAHYGNGLYVGGYFNEVSGVMVSNVARLSVGAVKLSQTNTFVQIPQQVQTNKVGLKATASSGLAVSFSVTSGPGTIANGTNLTFTGLGLVTVRASQAGNATYDAAAPVERTFRVTSAEPFRIQSVALTNSVVLRWPNPVDYGYYWPHVFVMYSTNNLQTLHSLYDGTNTSFVHTNLTPGQPYYYRIHLDVF
jgi:hypothetical protein